jgi:hypothetical protein
MMIKKHNLGKTEAVAKKRGSQVLVKVLASAVKLWLKSQLSGIEGLEIHIQGDNRDLLAGYIPQVYLQVDRGIYQGLHLTQASVVATNIRVNVGQVLKGQPLQLTEVIAIALQVQLTQSALQSSLSSPLFKSALKDLLSLLCTQQHRDPEPLLNQDLAWENLTLQRHRLTLKGSVTSTSGRTTPISISTGINPIGPSQLCLSPLQIDFPPYWLPLIPQQLDLDLGNETQIQELSLLPGLLFCRGNLLVKP